MCILLLYMYVYTITIYVCVYYYYICMGVLLLGFIPSYTDNYNGIVLTGISSKFIDFYKNDDKMSSMLHVTRNVQLCDPS